MNKVIVTVLLDKGELYLSSDLPIQFTNDEDKVLYFDSFILAKSYLSDRFISLSSWIYNNNSSGSHIIIKELDKNKNVIREEIFI